MFSSANCTSGTEFKWNIFCCIEGEISLNECMAGDHLVFDQYMKNLEDNHPLHRTRLSQQTWLRLGGSTDAVLRGLRERQAMMSFVLLRAGGSTDIVLRDCKRGKE